MVPANNESRELNFKDILLSKDCLVSHIDILILLLAGSAQLDTNRIILRPCNYDEEILFFNF